MSAANWANEANPPRQKLTMVEEFCSTPKDKAKFDKEMAKLEKEIEQRKRVKAKPLNKPNRKIYE